MTTKAADTAPAAKQMTLAGSYVAGSHAARVRAEHEDRRTELLARDEILAGEIDRRQQERHDINEALQLMSEPAPRAVVAMAAE